MKFAILSALSLLLLPALAASESVSQSVILKSFFDDKLQLAKTPLSACKGNKAFTNSEITKKTLSTYGEIQAILKAENATPQDKKLKGTAVFLAASGKHPCGACVKVSNSRKPSNGAINVLIVDASSSFEMSTIGMAAITNGDPSNIQVKVEKQALSKCLPGNGGDPAGNDDVSKTNFSSF